MRSSTRALRAKVGSTRTGKVSVFRSMTMRGMLKIEAGTDVHASNLASNRVIAHTTLPTFDSSTVQMVLEGQLFPRRPVYLFAYHSNVQYVNPPAPSNFNNPVDKEIDNTLRCG